MKKNNKLSIEKKVEPHYDGRELLCFVNRPNDFLEVFKDVVKNYPDRVALCFHEKIITYKQLDELSDNFAGGLLDSGLKETNILVINLSNSIDYGDGKDRIWFR